MFSSSSPNVGECGGDGETGGEYGEMPEMSDVLLYSLLGKRLAAGSPSFDKAEFYYVSIRNSICDSLCSSEIGDKDSLNLHKCEALLPLCLANFRTGVVLESSTPGTSVRALSCVSEGSSDIGDNGNDAFSLKRFLG